MVANISPRKARAVFSRAFEGKVWRGHRLVIRRVRGQGGDGGWSYEVRVDSLPAELRERLLADPSLIAADQGVPEEIDDPGDVARWRFEVIEAALKQPNRSRERARAIEAASRVNRTFPSGRRGRISVRAIQGWIAAYERSGMAGLKDRPRSDRGGRRAFVSRQWDRAVPFDDAAKAQIAEEVLKEARSLWAANVSCGWTWIARFTGDTLMKKTMAAGFNPRPAELRAICKASRGFVERARAHRAIAIHDNDRKRWADKHLPRVLRTRDGRKPMAIVIGDVHHLDIMLLRPDGSTYTPKLITWHDWATNRLFAHPVFLPKGRMVRQADVIEAYVAMVGDPEWGVPEVLYLDNGGEYNWAELIDDAQRLNTEVRCLGGDDNMVASLNARRSSIIKSLPYNAPAKAVEGLFGVLEGGVLSMLPGWIGGNRMKQKTANVGKKPAPYPLGEDEFRRSLALALEAYETHPQDGVLGGKSPRQVFAAGVEAGWERMDVNPDALRAVFARPEARTVTQGAFSYGGVKYTARAIQRLPAGTRIAVRIPLFGDKSRLPVLDHRGGFVCVAEPDQPYDALDPEGAREAARRAAEARAGIEDMRRETHPVNMEERLQALVSREPPAPVPESAGTIRLSGVLQRIGREMKIPPADRTAIEDAAEEQARAEQRALRTEVLNKLRANG